MASIVYVNRNVQAGAEVYNALVSIRNGIGTLQKLEYLKNEAIGAGQGTMQSIFGTGTVDEAQALADRWGAFQAAYEDGVNTEYAKLRDLINPLVAST